MTSQPDTPSDPPAGDAAEGSRLHIHGIKEVPAGHDEDIAVIFMEMRRALGQPVEQIADRLATSAKIIAGLESGALLALPDTSELTRIVTAYAALLGLDARPILRRIETQINVTRALKSPPAAPSAPSSAAPAAPPAAPRPASPANAPPPGSVPAPPSTQRPQPAPPHPPRQAPGTAPAPPQTPPPESAAAPPQPQRGAARRETGKKQQRGRRAGMMRPVLNWIILLGFVVALGAGVRYAALHPRMVWAAFDTLPEPIPRLMRNAWELVRPLEDTGPRQQITDPDNLKSDRLR